jgi:uncharacterized membrane protein
VSLTRDKVDYQGIVAVVLATSVGITTMAATIGIIWQRRSLSEAGGEVLIGLIGTVVGGLVGYLAGKANESSTPDKPDLPDLPDVPDKPETP